MTETDDKFGSLLFFRKNGQPGTNYQLCSGKTCIGSSEEADIRLKINDERLEKIHCIIDVTENGIATILNKSTAAPVSVNQVPVRKFKVLNNYDKIDLVGKQFQYKNSTLSMKEVEKHQELLCKAIPTPSKKRQSVAPVINVQSEKKLNFKTTTPVKKSVARNSFNGNRTVSVTPNRKLNRSQIFEKSKTTSKILASKPLISPTGVRKRRLSLGENAKKFSKSTKVSARNILLGDNITSSISKEIESVPSVSLRKSHNTGADFMDISNDSSSTLNSIPSEENVTSMRTPSTAPIKIKITQATPRTKTPKRQTPVSSKPSLNLSKTDTPLKIIENKWLESLKTSGSARKSTPLRKRSLKIIGSSRRSSGEVKKIVNTLRLIGERPMSVGSIPSIKKSASKRRKTEGSRLTNKALDRLAVNNETKRFSRGNIASISSDDLSEGSVLLNISSSSSSPIVPRNTILSTDSDIQNDPRLSLGKATPRKSHQRDRHSKIGGVDDKEQKDYSNSSSRKSLKQTEMQEGSSSEDSEVADITQQRPSVRNSSVLRSAKMSERVVQTERRTTSRTSTSRQSLRRSNLNGTERQSSHEDATSNTSSGQTITQNEDQDVSSLSSVSISSNDDYEEGQENHSGRSRQSFNWPTQSSTPLAKSALISNRRSSNKSVVDKELSVQLSRSTTPHDGRRSSLQRNSKANEEVNLSRISANAKSTGSRRMSVKEMFLSPSTSSENNSVTSVDDETKRYTSKHTRFSTNESQSEGETSDIESLNYSSKSKRSLSRNGNKSRRSVSVISVNDDSVKNTPENNTSVIILDTPFEKTRRISKKSLSKTLNSSVEDDADLTTPKSAIRSRRSQSLPYLPDVEDITPITPLERSGKNDGFKTPLNTPALFENIKKSVLRSRSKRISSHNLTEELSKPEMNKVVKRLRESTEMTDRPAKKRKMFSEDPVSQYEDLDASFESFATDEVFSNVEDQYVAPSTPQDFNNLTDKPVVNDPQTKRGSSLLTRRSFRTTKIISNISESDRTSTVVDNSSDSTDIFEDTDSVISSRRSSRRLSSRIQEEEPQVTQKSPMNDSNISTTKNFVNTLKEVTRKKMRSPKNDLTDIVGVRKLFSTPKDVKTPKNDLTRVPNLRKFMYPKQENSPKNDLSNVAGVKKLLSTPKEVKSPENDLRNVPNLRRIMYPKQENSPKNDLSNVAGVKKLLGTPKEIKSPENDLRNVPNLRKVMYPKHQNSPRNDLNDVAGMKKLLSTPKKQKGPKNDLSDVAGVKKLLSTPKTQNSPKNDLTKVPNLRKIMSPKQQNSPKNDLSDVRGLKHLLKTPRKQKQPLNDLSNIEGVADVFAVPQVESYSNSDQENNEDLFENLFFKKPVRTYSRGKSLSPLSRKAMVFGTDRRKTLGESPHTSPRIEKWIKDQAVIKLERLDGYDFDAHTVDAEMPDKKSRTQELKIENITPAETTTRGRKKKAVDTDTVKITKKTRGKKKNQEAIDEGENKWEGNSEVEVKPRSERVNKLQQQLVESPRSLRARRRAAGESPITVSSLAVTTTDGVDSTGAEPDFQVPPKRQARARKPSQKEDSEDQFNEVHSITSERSTRNRAAVKGKPKTTGRGRARKKNEDIDTQESDISEDIQEPVQKRGREMKVVVAIEETVKKVDGGRMKSGEVEDETVEEPMQKTKGKAIKRGRKKIVNEEEDALKETKDKTVLNDQSNLTKVTKRGRPKKIALAVTEDTVEEPAKNTRGKMVLQEDDMHSFEIKTIKEENPVHKPTKKNMKKEVLKEENNQTAKDNKVGSGRKEPVEEIEEAIEENTRPTRGGRGKRIASKESEIHTSEITVKAGRRRKVSESEDKENIELETVPTKTRNKRQAKKAKTDRSEDDEGSDEPASKKTIAIADENAENSPRMTRQKRGKFKKYGSEFLTENEVKTIKTVWFEDGGSDTASEDKKRKKENFLQAEETVRRSKRNCK